MNTETIIKEIRKNGTRKVTLGLRCPAELKNKLLQEAKALDINLSEFVENILLNKDNLNLEIESSIREIHNLKSEITDLKNLLSVSDKMAQIEIGKLKIEHQKLQNLTLLMKEKFSIFNDERLLQLFSEVKGQKMVVNSSNNRLEFLFENPEELLMAMIYSFRIRK